MIYREAAGDWKSVVPAPDRAFTRDRIAYTEPRPPSSAMWHDQHRAEATKLVEGKAVSPGFVAQLIEAFCVKGLVAR